MTDFKKYFSFKYTGWLMLGMYILSVTIKDQFLSSSHENTDFIDYYNAIFIFVAATLIILINNNPKAKKFAASMLIFFVWLDAHADIISIFHFAVVDIFYEHTMRFSDKIYMLQLLFYDATFILAGASIWRERIINRTAFIIILFLSSSVAILIWKGLYMMAI